MVIGHINKSEFLHVNFSSSVMQNPWLDAPRVTGPASVRDILAWSISAVNTDHRVQSFSKAGDGAKLWKEIFCVSRSFGFITSIHCIVICPSENFWHVIWKPCSGNWAVLCKYEKMRGSELHRSLKLNSFRGVTILCKVWEQTISTILRWVSRFLSVS